MLLDKYGDYPDRPWQADMVGTGICYAILTFRYNREIFTSFPSLRAEVIGIPLYDPRKDSSVGGSGTHQWNDRSTWEPSENVEVQKYNILRGIDLGGGNVWGGAAEAEDLPLANWWAEMNKADIAIVKDDGSTEPQWRASYEVFVNDEPAKVIEELNRGCSGEMVENGGIWKTRLGGPGLPLYFFTDDDVILSEPEENTPFSASRQPKNAVQGVYPDPNALWEPKDAPALYNSVQEAEDGGQRRVADLRFTAAPYPTQVQRVMHFYAQDERRFRQHLLNLPPEASMLEPLDVVSWTSAENGYIAKDWDVNSHVDPLTSGTSQFRIREVDQGDTFWSPDFEVPIGYANLNRTPAAPQAVAGFDLLAATVQDGQSRVRRPALRVIWDGDGQDDVRGVMWEIRLTGSTEVLLRGSTADVPSSTQLISEGILSTTSYEGRSQWIVDRPTDWTGWEEATTGDIRLGEADLNDDVWDRINAEGQEAFDRQNEVFDLVLDELYEVDIQNLVSQVIEDARVEGEVEETREELSTTNAEIETVKTTANTDRDAVAQIDQRLTSEIGTVSGEVSANFTTLSNLNLSFSQFQTDVQSQFAGNSGQLTQTFYTKAEANQVISASITSALSNVDGNNTSVTEMLASIDGLLGQWAIRVNNNGAISGISLLSEAVNGNVESTLVFDADRVFFGTSDNVGGFSSPFSFQNGILYAKDMIVDTLQLAGNSVTIPEEDESGQFAGTGFMDTFCSIVVDVPNSQSSDIDIDWQIEQGYANASPTWGFQLLDNGGIVDERIGMTEVTDFASGWARLKNVPGRRTILFKWQGSSADITCQAKLKVRVQMR